jgi:hypothetical protein
MKTSIANSTMYVTIDIDLHSFESGQSGFIAGERIQCRPISLTRPKDCGGSPAPNHPLSFESACGRAAIFGSSIQDVVFLRTFCSFDCILCLVRPLVRPLHRLLDLLLCKASRSRPVLTRLKDPQCFEAHSVRPSVRPSVRRRHIRLIRCIGAERLSRQRNFHGVVTIARCRSGR